MGPIQTAIGQAMGAIGGAAVLGKKMQEDAEKAERQAAKKATTKENEKAKGPSPMAKAIKTAQDKKLDSPKQVYFWGQDPEPLATSSELASVLANTSLQNATAAKGRAREKVRARRQALMKRKLGRRN